MKKNTSPLLITGVIVLALTSAVLGWQLNSSSSLNDRYETQITEMTEQMAELEAMMKKNGLGDLMEDDLKSSLNNLLEEYNDVTTNNKALNDSIETQKSKIVFLLGELESNEKKRKYTASELFKMKKEAETLRSVMKDYVHRIDSLNTLNQQLTAEIKQKDVKIDEISSERDNLKSETESLNSKIELGGKLQILNLVSEAIKVKSSGSFVETNRSRRADQVRSCFTIVSNKIATKGNKTFYVRVVGPGNKVLTGNSSKAINVGGNEVQTSVSRTIDYQGANVDLCIFFEKAAEVDFEDGEYTVEIYTEGTLVGKTTFALK